MSTRNELAAEILSMTRRGWTAKAALTRLLNTNETYRAYYDGLTTYARSALIQHIERICNEAGASK